MREVETIVGVFISCVCDPSPFGSCGVYSMGRVNQGHGGFA